MNRILIDTTHLIGLLKYDIPTADSVIPATGIVWNTTNVLTDDTRHFKTIKKLIKIIDLETAIRLAKPHR